MFFRRSFLRDHFLIAAGVILISIAGKNIYDPALLVTGGVTGIGIMMEELTGMPLWLSNALINIPLFFLALHFKGWAFVRRTFFAVVGMTAALMLLPDRAILPESDLFLTSVFGGLLTGTGLALVFLAMATTGGTDLMAALLQIKMRYRSITEIVQVLDWIIVLFGAGVFGIRRAMYALFSIFVIGRASASILDGMHYAKAALIVSEKSEEIAEKIMVRLDRGVTGIVSRGMHSGHSGCTLLSVFSNREIVILKDTVRETDPMAFIIVTDVREVIGEGFTREKTQVGRGNVQGLQAGPCGNKETVDQN